MSIHGQDATVVGGGIAGLAAALALARRGARVTVLEQAEQIREAGAGVQISPNGTRVLAALGVLPAVLDHAVRAEALAVSDHRDRRLQRLDLARLSAEAPWLFVHRGDLVSVMAEAAARAGVRIELGVAVDAARETGDGVALTLAGGQTRDVPLAIGADGLHSVLRAVAGPAPAARFTGQVAWRALVPVPAPLPRVAQLVLGPGSHLVIYPLRDRWLVNLVAIEARQEWTAEGWSHRADPDALKARFAGYAAPFRQLLGAVEEVYLWGLFRHPVATLWHGHRLAILGDAAHPTLPFLAQGACMALEDAVVLAACLDRHADRAAAFAEFQRLRRARCARIVGEANRNARAFHLDGPPFRPLLHGLLRAGDKLAPQMGLRRLDWLYGYDATRV